MKWKLVIWRWRVVDSTLAKNMSPWQRESGVGGSNQLWHTTCWLRHLFTGLIDLTCGFVHHLCVFLCESTNYNIPGLLCECLCPPFLCMNLHAHFLLLCVVCLMMNHMLNPLSDTKNLIETDQVLYLYFTEILRKVSFQVIN